MMRSLFLGGACLAGGFALGLVYMAPANKIYGLTGLDEQPGLTLRGVHGRLLQGGVEEIRQAGVAVNNLHWTLRPTALLLGRVALDVSLLWAGDNPARGEVKRSLSGSSTQLRGWQTRFSMAALQPLLRLPILPLDGQVQVELDRLTLNDQGKPQQAAGVIRLNAVQWTLLRPAAMLGQYQVDIQTDADGRIIGTISDIEAALGAQGQLTLETDGRYSLQLNLRPTPNTPPMIRNSLPSVAQLAADGGYVLNYSGRIPNW